MSTDSGDKAAMAGPLAESKALIEAAAANADYQEDLFATVTPEEMVEARQALKAKGEDAPSGMDVLREARVRRRGRPRHARNRRTDDFARYILSHGRDPALILIEIASTQPEVLMEASRRKRQQPYNDKEGNPVEYTESMSYQDAQALRIRCSDILMPYLHGKKPLQVDMTFTGLSDLIIAGQTHSDDEVESIIDADFTSVDGADDEDAK